MVWLTQQLPKQNLIASSYSPTLGYSQHRVLLLPASNCRAEVSGIRAVRTTSRVYRLPSQFQSLLLSKSLPLVFAKVGLTGASLSNSTAKERRETATQIPTDLSELESLKVENRIRLESGIRPATATRRELSSLPINPLVRVRYTLASGEDSETDGLSTSDFGVALPTPPRHRYSSNPHGEGESR